MSSNSGKCSVESCDQDADYEIVLYDYYSDGSVFFEQDYTCPFLCEQHVAENERTATRYAEREESRLETSLAELEIPDQILAGNNRRYRGVIDYKYSNRNRAQGFTIYKPVSKNN